MITYYFSLQFRMFNRKIRDAGLNIMLFYPLVLIGFFALSRLIFDRAAYGNYMYVVLGLLMAATLSEEKRNEFLHGCYPNKVYQLIRMMENIVITLPFVTYLLYRSELFPAAILELSSLLLSFTRVRAPQRQPIPTPFSRYPFEFAAGFRNSLLILLLAYALTAIGIAAANLNVSIFSIMLIYLITLTFYTKPEPDLYVWVYSMRPQRFLLLKIRRALLQSTALILLPAMAIGMTDKLQLIFVGITIITGAGFLAMMVLAKYAAYPEEINLPQAIVFAVCLSFPPMLLLVIPYFYYQSVQRLNRYLP